MEIHKAESPCIIFDEGAMCLGVHFSRYRSITSLQTAAAKAKKSLICPFAHSSVKRGKSYLTCAARGEGGTCQNHVMSPDIGVGVRDERSVGFLWTLKWCKLITVNRIHDINSSGKKYLFVVVLGAAVYKLVFHEDLFSVRE